MHCAKAVALLLADRQRAALAIRVALAEKHTNIGSPAGAAIGLGKVGIQAGALNGPAGIALSRRHRPGTQHTLRYPVVRGEGAQIDLRRPTLPKHPSRCRHEHIGVNQRATAQTGAHHRVHAMVVADIKQTIELAWLAGLGIGPEIVGKVMRAARKATLGVAFAPLQQQHLARPAGGQAAAHHGPAKPAADNDGFQKSFLCHGIPLKSVSAWWTCNR